MRGSASVFKIKLNVFFFFFHFFDPENISVDNEYK